MHRSLTDALSTLALGVLAATACGDGGRVTLHDGRFDAGRGDSGAIDAAIDAGDTAADARGVDAAPDPTAPVDAVNVFIGTDEITVRADMLGNGGGHTFPGAVAPFGMLAWSPDTTQWAGGYRWQHDTIRGFSLSHFSGRGISCYQDFPFMPTVGAPTTSPGSRWDAYASKFRHQAEHAAPGWYDVHLDSSAIDVAIAVTARTGMARIVFPPASDATLLVNTGGSANGVIASGTGVSIDGPTRFSGSAVSGNCGGAFLYKVYFAAETDRPFARSGTWSGATLATGASSATGADTGAYFVFDTSAESAVKVRVALSYVSIDGARANLASESAPFGWDFDALRASARNAWNDRLSSILVRGGTSDERASFYTALYHASIHPSVFSDASGDYVGYDGSVHRARVAGAQFHNFAAWDNYRSLVPLLAILAPDETSDMMQSVVNDAAQDPGGGLPRWQHASSNSGGMVGDHQDAALASAHAFGASGFDAEAALAAMVKGASVVGTTSGGHAVREGVEEWLAKGYVSTSAASGSAARSLEYATDDAAVSRLAAALGHDDLSRAYRARSAQWKTLWHDGWITPRNADGTFVAPFEPSSVDHFVEGDGAQYLWHVPFDLRGLFDAMGGNAAAIARLDAHATMLNDGPHSAYLYMGNEPDFEVPWEYDFAGAPWRTQDVVRRVVRELYSNTPHGMPGNDDGGAMGSWLVWAMIGLYPEIPGVAGLVVASPLFTRVDIRLPGGRTLVIDAPDASADARYVQSLAIDGRAHASPWIAWDMLSRGATVRFALSTTPNTAWGSDVAVAPPSFGAP